MQNTDLINQKHNNKIEELEEKIVEFQSKLHRRNMQIKELKKNNFSLEELKQFNYWWEGIYSGTKALHDKVVKLINNR